MREAAKTFDFVGLFLLAIGMVLLLLGFQFAQSARNGWRAPQTIISLIVGIALLVLGFVNELDTPRDPIIPPKLLKKRTTVSILISCFIHTFTLFGASYYVPLYFQILGASATMAGVKQLPISLGSSVTAIVVGFIIMKTKRYRPVIWAGWVILTIGYGLMILLSPSTPAWEAEVILLVAGIGIGTLFQPPLTALQAAMEIKYLATSTATFMFIRCDCLSLAVYQLQTDAYQITEH